MQPIMSTVTNLVGTPFRNISLKTQRTNLIRFCAAKANAKIPNPFSSLISFQLFNVYRSKLQRKQQQHGIIPWKFPNLSINSLPIVSSYFSTLKILRFLILRKILPFMGFWYILVFQVLGFQHFTWKTVILVYKLLGNLPNLFFPWFSLNGYWAFWVWNL